MHEIFKWTLALGLLSGVADATTARADTPTPELVPVRVAFAPIDDGSYHVVMLINDNKPCNMGPGTEHSQVVIIKDHFKNPNGVFVASIGCWEVSGDTVTVKYMNASTNTLWHKFDIRFSATQQMIWKWQTDSLFPQGSPNGIR